MEKKEKVVCLGLWLILAAVIVIPVKGILLDGVYSWHIRQRVFIQMMAECLVIFLVLCGIWMRLQNRHLQWFLTAAVCLGFIWCHVMFLPLLVSGIYAGYLFLIGYCIRGRLLKVSLKHSVFADFLLGCGSVMALFCLLSVVGAGSIPMLKAVVALTGVLVAAVCIPVRKEWQMQRQDMRNVEKLLLILMLLMVLIQIGRMNISVDFDSLWYGVRSEYMLDNGGGIYENPGSVGLVYTYSKGMEVLLLPLSDLSSHSYLISFNIWLVVLVLAAVYRAARYYMDHGWALVSAAAVSTIPAIMNMSITAKTDVMTLAVQMVMILYMLAYLRDKEVKHLAVSAGALFLSWTLKPTAVVFSTAVFGMSFLYLLATRQFSLKASRKQWMLLVPFLAALAGIWARTVWIAGIPITSVFSSIFLKLGFSMKYPFSDLPLYGDSAGDQSVLVYLAKTVCKMLLLPVGENMNHVVFAWGTSLMCFLPLAGLLLLPFKKRRPEADRNLLRFAHTVLIPFVLVCLVSLAMLGQIDGNYFMLLYIFVILYGFGVVSSLSSERLQMRIRFMLVPFLAFNLVMTAVSNWSWSLGFTPIQLLHKGSYDHEQMQKEAMISTGNEEIWNILAKDSRTRVIAAGDHPGVFAFPCNVQSYADITSSWGNVALVKTMDAFVEYLEYAKTDYIYMQAGEVESGSRCHELMGYLIEAGILTDVLYEEGNLLAAVDLDGTYSPEASAAYGVYFERYQVR